MERHRVSWASMNISNNMAELPRADFWLTSVNARSRMVPLWETAKNTKIHTLAMNTLAVVRKLFWIKIFDKSWTYMLKHFRSRPKLIKQTEWEFEFEPCIYFGDKRSYWSGPDQRWVILQQTFGPDHCEEVLRNCKPVMVERRDGSPCKLGPDEGLYGVG